MGGGVEGDGELSVLGKRPFIPPFSGPVTPDRKLLTLEYLINLDTVKLKVLQERTGLPCGVRLEVCKAIMAVERDNAVALHVVALSNITEVVPAKAQAFVARVSPRDVPVGSLVVTLDEGGNPMDYFQVPAGSGGLVALTGPECVVNVPVGAWLLAL